jgi:hypothetical protein
VVFPSGEAGVGKTVLVRHLAHAVAGRATVLIGAAEAEPRETARAYIVCLVVGNDRLPYLGTPASA